MRSSTACSHERRAEPVQSQLPMQGTPSPGRPVGVIDGHTTAGEHEPGHFHFHVQRPRRRALALPGVIPTTPRMTRLASALTCSPLLLFIPYLSRQFEPLTAPPPSCGIGVGGDGQGRIIARLQLAGANMAHAVALFPVPHRPLVALAARAAYTLRKATKKVMGRILSIHSVMSFQEKERIRER